jgi:phosphate transport system substrate-binding protein
MIRFHAKRVLVAAAAVMAFAAAQAADISGAGATFPYPIYSKWADAYKQQTGIGLNYQSIGSGGGIRQVTSGTVDFAASDVPMTNAQLAESKVKLIHIPTVLGAVVPIYNLPGVNTELRFAPDVLADIYLGKISNWNDSRIAKDNPGVNLPNLAINVVHRSEGSGTTFIFTDYLSKVSADWKNTVGANSAVSWPKGVGAKGNESVAGMVRQLPGTIGYVELIYAMQNKISFGYIKNAAGTWVKGSIAGVTEAAASVKSMPADYRVSITNAPGKTAYPIASFTWLLIPTQPQNAANAKVIKDFLDWMLDHGQSEVQALYYAPLPDSVITKVKASVSQLK